MQQKTETVNSTRNNLSINPSDMGNNKHYNGTVSKQHKGSSDFVFGNNISLPIFNFERIKGMATFKFAIIIADLLGISTFFLGIIDPFNDFKSVILSVIGGIYVLARTIFYCIIKYQIVMGNKNKLKKESLEIWHLEMNKKEREAKMQNPEK